MTTEEDQIAWLWKAFPSLKVTPIASEGGSKVMVSDVDLKAYLQKSALYFYRSGQAS